MKPVSPRDQWGSDDPKLFMNLMAVLVACPFSSSLAAFSLESTLGQGLLSWICLLAPAGQSQSCDWVLNSLMALQSNNIYHTSCFSPLENDISQCNFAPQIFPVWVLTFRVKFSLTASPFPYFVYLWEVAQIRLPQHSNGIRSYSHMPFT